MGNGMDAMSREERDALRSRQPMKIQHAGDCLVEISRSDVSALLAAFETPGDLSVWVKANAASQRLKRCL